MAETDTTTLVSLFHTQQQAQEAISDLQNAGIPASGIQSTGGSNGVTLASLHELGLPPEDVQLLTDGVKNGGIVILISGAGKFVKEAESIFKKHHAHKVDEQTVTDDAAPLYGGEYAGEKTTTAGDVVIPVVEEELVVGKRAVRTGGVRVVSRTVETPVEETITLREERAVVERRPVDRAVTEADLRDQSIEVMNRGEEAVVSKTAKVVEEVVIGKDSGSRTERVTDTVRKTEIEVEQVAGDKVTTAKGTRL